MRARSRAAAHDYARAYRCAEAGGRCAESRRLAEPCRRCAEPVSGGCCQSCRKARGQSGGEPSSQSRCQPRGCGRGFPKPTSAQYTGARAQAVRRGHLRLWSRSDEHRHRGVRHSR